MKKPEAKRLKPTSRKLRENSRNPDSVRVKTGPPFGRNSVMSGAASRREAAKVSRLKLVKL